MKKFITVILTIIISVFFTACHNINYSILQNESSSQYTKNEESSRIEITEGLTESPTESTTEVLIPSIDDLNDEQKALLPFYDNGFCLSSGDRDLYYMGELIASYIPIYADNNNYYWTITDDFKVYFRGEVGYENAGKWLMSYDVKTGEKKELRNWDELEKYGKVDFFISDGSNVFIAFNAGQSLDTWYNIVKIDENGNDKLVCKTEYGSYDSDSDINYGYLGHAMNFGEENIFYTIGKYDDHDEQYLVKVKIDFSTGEYEVVDKEAGVIKDRVKINSNGDKYWSEVYQVLPNSMYFLPDNIFYYGETRQEVDELNGEVQTVTDIIKVDRNTREEKIIGTFDHDIYEYHDGNSCITDKYLIYSGSVMDLENGEVIDYDTFVSENKADKFFNMSIQCA